MRHPVMMMLCLKLSSPQEKYNGTRDEVMMMTIVFGRCCSTSPIQGQVDYDLCLKNGNCFFLKQK